MTSVTAYTAFLDLANKLGSNDDVNIDIGRFVLLFNKHAKIWLDINVRKSKATQSIDVVQQLVKKDVLLTVASITDKAVNFKLPTDWFEHSNGYTLCTSGTCKDKVIYMDQVKNESKRLILFDENWRPDFDFEWLPIAIGQDQLQAFYKDFIIQEAYIDYYRYPTNIDIQGYKNPDGTLSTNVDPDLDDIYVNEIIDLVVADVSKIYQNNDKAQLDLNRIQQEQLK